MLPSYVADVVLLQWEREDPSSYRLRKTFKGKSKSNFLFLRVQLKHKLKIFPERRAVEKATVIKHIKCAIKVFFQVFKHKLLFSLKCINVILKCILLSYLPCPSFHQSTVLKSFFKAGYNHWLKSRFPSFVVCRGRFDSKLLLKELRSFPKYVADIFFCFKKWKLECRVSDNWADCTVSVALPTFLW